jgi:hypothetical protein
MSKTEYAEPGKLVDSFPANLILSSSSLPNNSFDFTYDGSKQSTAAFFSKLSPKDAYNQYKKYLITNGYKIVSDISVKANSYNVYASSKLSDVSLAIQLQGKDTQVTINYIKK